MVMRDSLLSVGVSYLLTMPVRRVKRTVVRKVDFGDCAWSMVAAVSGWLRVARKSNRQIDVHVHDGTVSVCLYAYPSLTEPSVKRTGLTGPNYYLSR